MTDLREVLDLHDRFVAAAVGVAPDEEVDAAARAGRSARRRVAYLGHTVVVALAGGTGSGKSSLLNAMAGEEVSEAGARRPTTGEVVAWTPDDPEPGLIRLLDDLGVAERTANGVHPWLAVLDLPDTDSIVEGHRLTVDRVLPLVDAVVWVLDPEKYQDARLHRDHIRPLAGWSDRFVFALNQVDRLAPGDVERLEADLRRSLQDDGIPDPVIVRTAGDPPNAPPDGIDDLLATLAELGSARHVVTRRVVTALTDSASRLAASMGGAETGFERRWGPVKEAVVASVDDAVAEALSRNAEEVAASDAAVVSGLRRGEVAEELVAVPVVAPSAADPVTDMVAAIAPDLEPAARAEIERIGRSAAEEIGEVADDGTGTRVPLPDAPAWWGRIRVVSYGLVALVAIAAVWSVVVGLSGGNAGPTVLLALVGAGLLAAEGAVVIAATRGRVDEGLRVRQETRGRAVAELERRLGGPMRQVLRTRSVPMAAHAEFVLAVRRFEEDGN